MGTTDMAKTLWKWKAARTNKKRLLVEGQSKTLRSIQGISSDSNTMWKINPIMARQMGTSTTDVPNA